LNQGQPGAVALDPDRQGFRQGGQGFVRVVEGEYPLHPQIANRGGHPDKTTAVGAQGIHHLIQRFVEHVQAPVQPVGAMPLITGETDYPLPVEQSRLAFLQDRLAAVEQARLDRMLKHQNPAGITLLGHQETRAQRAHFALGGAYAQRTPGIGGHLDQQFAVAQDHQSLLSIELQVDRALGVQAQAAAIGQVEVPALPTPGVQVGEQVVAQWTARPQPQTATEQAEACDQPQCIAARFLGLQEQLSSLRGLAGNPSIKGAQGIKRAAEAFLQRGPGLCVGRVHGQPGIEAFLQSCVGLAGAQLDHPVDGLLAERVQARRTHELISLRQHWRRACFM
jgi:hypothetical protein